MDINSVINSTVKDKVSEQMLTYEELLHKMNQKIDSIDSKIKNPQDEQFLTVQQVEEMFGIEKTAIYNRIKEGLFKRYRFAGSRRIYFKKSEIINSLELVDNE